MNEKVKWIAIAAIGVAGIVASVITHEVRYAEIGIGAVIVLGLLA